MLATDVGRALEETLRQRQRLVDEAARAAGLPGRGAPAARTASTAYGPYSAKPNVTLMKTAICARLTAASGQ
jgi:hypothetical protein